MDKYVLDAQRAHLVGLLDAIQRCVYSLDASGQKLTWPLSAEFLEKHKKNVEIFESLAAINERFAKLQDTLGAAMRHANLLAGEPSETFLKVLGFYEKAGVLESVASWQLCRTTRSLATHDYETEYAEIADHFNSLQTLISEGAQEVRRPPSSRRSRGFCRSPRVSVGVDKIQGNRHGVESFVPVMARRGVACRDGRKDGSGLPQAYPPPIFRSRVGLGRPSGFAKNGDAIALR